MLDQSIEVLLEVYVHAMLGNIIDTYIYMYIHIYFKYSKSKYNYTYLLGINTYK